MPSTMSSTHHLNRNGIPSFKALITPKSGPFLCAWGLYGDKDLNRLTDGRVRAAAYSEIRTGKRVSLNWPLDGQKKASFFHRSLFHLDILPNSPDIGNDDVWTFNPQVTSQWDGLRHYAYQKEKKFYNGVTMEDIHNQSSGDCSTINGIHAWAEKGIVGRGILVDYHSWRASRSSNTAYDPLDTTTISLEDIKSCLAAQNTEVKFGDILLVRSGKSSFMATLASKTEDEISSYKNQVPHRFGGLGQDIDTLQWIWEHFSAVAGDQPSFECWPPLREDWSFHEILLAGWGCPIGELFDLEQLAEQCKKINRWTFFFVSEPCNVPGGVSSPPNAIAIF